MATAETPLLAAVVIPAQHPAIEFHAASEHEGRENPDRPTGFKFSIFFGAILMGDFAVGYDTSCVSTLTPMITTEFMSIDDLGWYGIAYVLAMVSTVLTFGQLYTIYPMKAIFLASFFTFGVGSVISASANSSAVFILGRAVSGLGGSGIFAGGSM
jgi:MFS family permease